VCTVLVIQRQSSVAFLDASIYYPVNEIHQTTFNGHGTGLEGPPPDDRLLFVQLISIRGT
jgi:hypothetical protein